MSSAVGTRAGAGWLAKLLSLLFLVAAGVAMAVVLRNSGAEVLALVTQPGGGWYLLSALGVLSIGLTLSVAAWRSGFAGFGAPVGFGAGWRIYTLANLGKYLPGKVWAVVAAVRLAGEVGVPARRTVAATALNMLVVMATAAGVGMLAAPYLLGLRTGWLAVPLLAGVLLLWRPELVVRLANRVARWLRREPVSEHPDPAQLRWAVCSQVVSWLVGGMHLWLFAVLLGAEPVAALPLSVGAFALATVVGSLVVVLPDGVGVRELVTVGVLAVVLPVPAAGAAALASRAACVLVDLLGAAAGLLVVRGRRMTGRNREGRRARRKVHERQ